MNEQQQRLYKVLDAELWREAEATGRFSGAGIDHTDGFIHLSASEQVIETVTKHFAGVDNLLIVEVNGNTLGESLRWEPSRDGDLFPHVYGDIPMSAIVSTVPLLIGEDGKHQFPADL